MRPSVEMIERAYRWPNMYKQVQSLVEKCDLPQRYAKPVKLLHKIEDKFSCTKTLELNFTRYPRGACL